MPPSTETIDLDSLSRGSGALLIAAFVAALVPAIASHSLFVLATALLATLAHAAFLGAPLFLLLRHFCWANRLTAIVAGFLIGVIPTGIDKWPSASNTGHAELIDNVPTRVFSAPVEANWPGYVESLILPGMLGALAGFAFWFSLTIFRRSDLSAQDRAKERPWRNPFNIVAGLALIALASTSAHATLGAKNKDMTCHNMSRDGRTSITPKLSMGLDIPIEEWGNLANVFDEFSTAHSLSLQKSGTVYPETVRAISLSLCSEAGFNIQAIDQRWAHKNYAPMIEGRGLLIGIYETREGSPWQDFGEKFVNALEAKWPDKLKFVGTGEPETPRPEIITGTTP